MKVALTSDTHYGYSHNTHRVHEKFLTRLAADIKAQDVRVLIHAGDWGTNKQDQFQRTLAMFRRYIDIPIVAVRGNHDLWDYKKNWRIPKISWLQMQADHRKWFNENNILHLEDGSVTIEDVLIVGFDGWYYKTHPATNDEKHCLKNIDGAWFHTYHSKRAYNGLDAALLVDDSRARVSICVTHHPPFDGDENKSEFIANPSFYPFIKERFDVFCTGHSHEALDIIEDGCRVLNCGSHYDKPKYVIFDV